MDDEQYAAHLVEFVENNWQQFVTWSTEYDYTEEDLEKMNSRIRKAAGQTG